MNPTTVQYVSDENGSTTAVIVPIELGHEIKSTKETAYLPRSKSMKQRLLAARKRKKGIPFDEARKKLGI